MGKLGIVFDASQYDMFLLCAERYRIRYRLNKALPRKAQQLDRGTICHVGNEVYYQALMNGERYDDAVPKALSEIRKAGTIGSDLEPEAIERCIDVMEEYYDYWRVADENMHIVGVEQPFLYILHEDDDICISMAGKIDLIVNDNKYTNLPYDHKTFDRDSEVIRMTNQFRNYANAVDSNYLMVNRIGFQKTLKPHEKFKRVMLSYDPLAIKQWKDNVVMNITHYLTCVSEDKWPMNETSCDKYHRRCEYFNVCDSSGQEAKLYKLDTDYIKTKPWDVTQALRKASQELEDKIKEGLLNETETHTQT